MKVGTIGSGTIVHLILSSMQELDNISCEAVYSRTMERARELADKYQIGKCYTSLDEMFSDKDIGCIYIASPNSLHYEQAKKALQAGKHVICEKLFTNTLEEAKELICLAKEKRLFLFEGITTMYLPNYRVIKEKLASVGRIRLISCCYCQYSSKYDAFLAGENPNAFNPAFGGGALADINLYNIYFIIGLFGKPLETTYYPNRHQNGIDTSGVMILRYPDFVCTCTGAKDTWGSNAVQIMGEKGYIYVTDGSNGCKEVKVITKKEEQIFNEQGDQHQWYLEMRGIAKIIEKGDYEDCYRRLETTEQVVEVIQGAR